MMDRVGFVLAKLLEALLAPSFLLLLASVLGAALVLGRIGRRRGGRLGPALLACSLGLECAIAILPLDSWALAPLEDRFPTCRRLPPDLYGVVTLGGAVDPAITAARGIPTLNEAAQRMTELVRVARLLPRAVLAFSGGSGRIVPGRLSEADVARVFFDEFGLSARPVVYEGRSRTTWENARDLASLVHPAPAHPWLLITSAAHMPRAVAAFRAAGFDVIADPVAYQTAPTLASRLAPGFPERLARLDEAAHEWGGLVSYVLLGRTRRLLPAPQGEGCS